MRTLFIGHCSRFDVFVVRGRCFCSHNGCHASSRVLEGLRWHWDSTNRFYVVYKDGYAGIVVWDPVPGRLEKDQAYARFCQCNLVGKHWRDWFDGTVGWAVDRGWHHPGTCCAHLRNMKAAFGLVPSYKWFHPWSGGCMCSGVKCPCPRGPDIKHAMGEHIVAALCRVMVEV